MIGPRMMMKKKSAPAWTNPYVTDGLIAMWDGEWNAGGGVHDASATTWVDLTGSGNDWSILSNGSWGDDSFLVNDKSATIGHSITNYSFMDVVLRRTSGRDAIYFGDTYHGCSFTTSYFFAWLNGANSRVIPNEQASDRKLFSVDTTVSNFKCYLDASEVSTSAYAYTRSTLDESWLGSAYTGVSWSGEICNIRLYSRALTADEIAANYAIDKQRFKLP